MPGALLDDQLEQQDDHDVAGRLEQALVELVVGHALVPRRGLEPLAVAPLEDTGDAVVLPQEDDVEAGAADGGTAVLETDGEEELLLAVADAREEHVEQEGLVSTLVSVDGTSPPSGRQKSPRTSDTAGCPTEPEQPWHQADRLLEREERRQGH